MKEYLPRKAVFLLLLCFIFYFTAAAQTPGLIYKPAIGNGAKVLDPNADGYVSIAKTGFGSSADEGSGISEIPYRPFPALITEPIADLSTGSSGGHTDLATPNSSSAFTGSPVAAFFDGTNVLFRLRLGGSSTASKGYSVLIDSDQKFDGTGTNPGFEYEVLLASNFSVQVIRHTGTGSSTIFTGSADQYSQRSVAASASGGNPDYFYDFYVPLTAFGGGITAATPLRMSGITISSAQSGITGTVSDVGGVDFRAYNHDAPSAWRALIGVFPPTSLSTLQTSAFPQIAATAPVVASPILANSTSITGSSVEAPGSTITVYRSVAGGTPTIVGTTTVTANGTWTLTGISSSLLLQGNIITATVTASGKSVSAASAPVTVSSGICATLAPRLTSITGTTGSRYLVLTPSFSGNQIITVYNLTTGATQTTQVLNLTAGTAFPASSTGAPSALLVAQNNSYAITSTPADATGNPTGCQSLRSNQLCYTSGGNSTTNPHAVSITGVTYNSVTNSTNANSTTEVPLNLTSITVSITYNGGTQAGNLVLYRNGSATNVSAPYAVGTTTQTLTVSGISPALAVGDVLNVRTVQTAGCAGASLPSNFLTVQETTASPTINPLKCGLVTTLSGTSTEAAGTTLQFYTGGTAGSRDGTLITQSGTTTPITATVTSTGFWSVDLSAAASGGIAAGTLITARAKAPGEVRSVNSNAVSSTPGPTGVLAITTPITEGDTKVAGTGPTSAAGSTVTLYIEDTPFPTNVVVASDGKWEVSGIASTELFAGAKVTATFTPTNGCESIKSAVVTVSCKAPLTTFSMSAPPASICGGSIINMTLSGSEYGISYRLLVNGAESGASVLGTGGPITLVSGPITNYTSANTTASITYRARKVSGTACDATYASAATVTVQPQPAIAGLLFTSTSQAVCANSSANFSLNGTNPNYNYQLVNQTTNQLVGSAVQGSSTAAITLSTGTVTTNMSYSLRITSRTGDVNSCATVLSNQVSVTITSPSITRAVYPTASKVCVGGATNINVSTEPNNDFEYTVYRRAGTSPSPSSDSPLGTFRGNGQVQSVSTGSLGTAGTQTFYVTVRRMTNNVCGTLTLVNTAQVEVTNQPAIANAGSDRNVCGTTATLQGNAPTSGNGIWSQVGTTPTVARIVDPNNPNTTIENLQPGTYTFRWTVTVDCGGTTSSASDDVILTVNCEASYTLAIPKYKDTYSSGNVLATASDQDGTIISATILQGTLPAGVELSAENGLITVVRPNALVEGVYPLTISLMDQYRMTTVTTIVLRILGDSPVIVPLPVELVYLRASVQQRQVVLQWLTASETDNKEFIVERSMDGKDFNAIGTVAGAGTTLQPQHYTFTDAAPLQQVIYYRLKQVDFNGDSEYSKVVAVRLNAEASEQRLKVWPNPFKGEASIEVFAEEAGSASITLTAMQGQRVYESTVQLDPGYNKLTLPPLDLPNGMYILRLQNEQLIESTKVVKE
ncbi:Por secretion system C-terminal sorting domain-containing protein [Pontibacter chinhatensis]|uniref:Por secretion system C-terminal sorting domain-containing protein n=1 Tax=Pontibacter chinhatensis TaxID=1436961 RepID=A0A1I2WIZ2_9BACT|nr:Por secretion system C-terminal sorting domain-containing protein [Pontibacter chinhatensis]